ncbi:tetratricopeptide repeat protein [Leptolyngbya sp. FACHB-321]|uniref:tetratricopeptide repeat protein n=1 Tax=Leptolyngbya sp. FACHB-321 TaxID=2692807 RepID=UPI001689F54F|nr:tetratricopeptide repeat protein [Leptolyngbya sp. FACHB-321]MBD2036180.1 tetratricopeptide repeat protein [Leptolyngbya sp. FACHB-321]
MLSLTCIYYAKFWYPYIPFDGNFARVQAERRQYKRKRRFAVLGAVATPLIVFAIFYVWTYYIPSVSTVLSIADFHEADSIDKFHIGSNIRQKLRFSTTTENEKNIKFRPLSKTFTEQQRPTAIGEGKQQKATILIWGWYNEFLEEKGPQLGINSLFELLNPPLDFSRVGEAIGAVNEQGSWTLPPLSNQLTPAEVSSQFNSLSSEMTYLTLFTIGLGHYKAGQLEKTVEHFNTAINHFDTALGQLKEIEEPKSKLNQSFVHFYRSNALFYKALFSESGVDYGQAIDGFTTAIELTSDSPYASLNFEGTNIDQQTSSIVLASYSPASRSESDVDATGGTQEIVCTNQKRDTHILVNSSEAQLKAYLARAYNNRGLAYAMKGDKDKALADYAQAALLDSEIDEVCNNLGVMYAEQGKYKLAIRNYERAISNSDDIEDTFAYNNR